MRSDFSLNSAFDLLLLLLGTWQSACYQRVDVLSQLLDSYSAFELLLGTWPSASYHSVGTFFRSYETSYSAFELLLGTLPSAWYQRVDVPSQLLLDSSLHVGFRNYQSSPTRRARTENKKSQLSFQRVQQSCHARSSRLLGQRLCDSMHV